MISIHTPAWGATNVISTADQGIVFQSTLPRGERPYKPIERRIRQIISIHTPAWGATVVHSDKITCHAISIHTPAWGATVSITPRNF